MVEGQTPTKGYDIILSPVDYPSKVRRKKIFQGGAERETGQPLRSEKKNEWGLERRERRTRLAGLTMVYRK